MKSLIEVDNNTKKKVGLKKKERDKAGMCLKIIAKYFEKSSR